MKVQYVTIHDTANTAPAKNEIQYMITNSKPTSFHFAVDEHEVIQGLPLNRNSWSAGDGVNGEGNRKSISIEICRPKNPNRDLYNQSEENAVYLAARLLHKYNLGINNLKKHQDWSGKKCPNIILSENRWTSFKNRVEWVLNGIKNGTILPSVDSGSTGITSSNTIPKADSHFLVEIIVNELNIRKLPSLSSSVVGTVKKGQIFTIVEENNGFGKLKSGVGYIRLSEKYIKRK